MILDIAVAAALLISCIIAVLRGFIREILTIAGAVGGAVAAFYAGPLASPVVRGWLGVEKPAEGETAKKLFDVIPYTAVADALAYGGIFISVVIVLSVISHFLAKGAKAAGLGPIDRLFGLLFGAARAALIVALLYLPVYLFVEKETRDEWFTGSRVYAPVETMTGWVAAALPEDTADRAQKKAGDAAGEMAKTTREKLQEMDLLKSPSSPAAPEQTNPEQTAPASGPGYEPAQRQDLQNLMQDQGAVND